jgi:O-antigen/teichoic acid export membrane protein
MLLVPLGELELPRSLAYEVSRVEEIPRGVIATSFWLALALGVLQALFLAALLPFYLPSEKLYLLAASRWFMVYLPAAYIMSTLMGSDQGGGRFGRFSVLLSAPGAIYVVVILGAWGSGHVSPTVFAAGVLAGTVIVAIWRTQMDWSAISHTLPDWTTARRLLKRGLGFYLPAIASFVLSRTDMFILVRLAPSEAIGLYAVAQAVALGQIGAVSPFLQVGFAAVAGEIEPRQALQTLARHFRLAQLAVISVGVLAAAISPWLIKLMFGAQFAGAVTTTYLLIGSTVLWGLEQVLEQGLRAAGHSRIGIASNLAGLVVLLALGIPGYVRFGINSLAAASLSAQFVNLSILVGFCGAGLKMRMRGFWAFDAHTIHELKAVGLQVLKQFEAKETT